MFPEIVNLQFNQKQEEKNNYIGETLLFDFRNNNFVIKDGKPVKAEGIAAIKIFIEKLLKTPINRFKIYENTEYGTGIEDSLLGYAYNQKFVESEIQREIIENIETNKYIERVENLITKQEDDILKVSFDIILKTNITTSLPNGEIVYVNSNLDIDTIKEIEEFLNIKFLTNSLDSFTVNGLELYVSGY